MFVVAAATVAFLHSGSAALAYVARFYEPGKMKSWRRVYTCQADGKSRKLVSSSKNDAYSILWAGKDRLVWLENVSDKQEEVWTAKLGGQAKKLRTLKSNFAKWDQWGAVPPGRAILTDGKMFVEVLPEGKLRATEMPKPVLKCWNQYRNLGNEHPSTIVVPGIVGGPLTINISGDKPSVVAKRPSGTSTIWAGGYMLLDQLLTTQDGATAYIVGYGHDSTSGGHYELVKYDFATGSICQLIEDAWGVDFWPGREMIAWITPKSMEKLDSRFVYTSSLVVSHTRSGEPKTLVHGLVFVWDVAVRPSQT